jgi:hypothetical protein
MRENVPFVKSLRAAKSAAVKRGTEWNSVESRPATEPLVAASQNDETHIFPGNSEENAGSDRVSLMGLEPMAYGLKVRCSTT